jgi:hypothetical protein
MLATGAMLLRNYLILAILALQAFAYSLVPMLIMLAATAILLRFGAGAAIGATSEPTPDLKLEQPFSLKAALKFGVIFLVLSVAGVLAQRSLGVFGPPGRVQSLNPRAWRTNRTFCSASSIQAMTDTSFVGCVLAIFGLGLGIGM